MHNQNQTTQAQLQAYMQQSQTQFNQVLNTRSPGADGSRKKDPPTCEGKLNEYIELWIFMAVEYYLNKQYLMQADSSEFVALISNNLGKSV